HCSYFVGREEHLAAIEGQLKKPGGGVSVITGRLFNIDGAGGVGKTTLALEARERFGGYFADGVLSPIRADEHSPMSFVMELGRQLKVELKEPPDKETARVMVSELLRERRVLVILDNAVDWKELVYMLPEETAGTILVTTRSRDMAKRLRLPHFKVPPMQGISLEKFTGIEALALFEKMLDEEYDKEQETVYLQIAERLGFMPLALRQIMSLMLYGAHEPARVVLEKLQKESRLDLLQRP
ncbi:MAG: hypothetical protein GY765_27230, partial [bacterium]|nr:hypothetical protein [bacterium]